LRITLSPTASAQATTAGLSLNSRTSRLASSALVTRKFWSRTLKLGVFMMSKPFLLWILAKIWCCSFF